MMGNNYSQVTIANSEIRSLQSPSVNQEYKLLIAKPKDFAESKNTYPVLYVLDADWHFGMFTQIVRTMEIFQEVPELLIVGIGYPTEIEGDLWALRTRDYTPTEDKEFVEGFTETHKLPMTKLPEGSGGAKKFLQFIQEELVPFMETNYRADSEDRIVAGWSFGGLFASYVLFHQPDTFSRYIILSPAFWWGENITFEYEREFASKYNRLRAKLFLSAGGLESSTMISNLEKMVGILQDRTYEGLELTKLILEDETHLSVVAGTFSKGIRAIFREI